MYADDSLLDDDDDGDNHEEKAKIEANNDDEDSTQGHQQQTNYNKRSQMTQIESMIFHHYRRIQRQQRATRKTRNNNDNSNKVRHVGRRAAALLIRPSMTMVASMIWIALAPYGITAYHIQEWIANGSLPLMYCFDLLSSDEQQKLHTIRFFFKLSKIPSKSVLERHVRALHVACRYKPRKIYVLKRKKKLKSNDDDEEREQQQQEVEERKKLISRSTYDFKAGRVITPSSVPMLAARFVSDLGLNQKVLDFTLALMGLKVATKEEGEGCFLPQPLYKARPDFILDPAKILGVIVVACKLVPDQSLSRVNQLPEWYLHSYSRPMSTSADDESDEDDIDSNRRARKRARRFVPRTDHHFRYISQGGLMEDYLEFLEEELIDTKDPLLIDSIDELKQQETQPRTNTKTEASTSEYRHQHRHTTNRRGNNDDDEGNIVVKPSTTVGYYCKRQGGERAKRRQKEWRKYEISNIPEPGQYSTIPGPIGPLIEHMANKSGTSPVDVMNFVAELDKSMEKRGKPQFDYGR